MIQLVDLYPTVLAAVGKPLPPTSPDKPLHGVNLMPVLDDPRCRTRDYALMGQFGQSVSITDGRWILHQAPVEGNQPLNWYGACLAKFMPADLGAFDGVKRPCVPGTPLSGYWWGTPTWLSDKSQDMNELNNLADKRPDELRRMQRALRDELRRLRAPEEQLDRLELRHV